MILKRIKKVMVTSTMVAALAVPALSVNAESVLIKCDETAKAVGTINIFSRSPKNHYCYDAGLSGDNWAGISCTYTIGLGISYTDLLKFTLNKNQKVLTGDGYTKEIRANMQMIATGGRTAKLTSTC